MVSAIVAPCRYTSISGRDFHPKWEEKFRIPVANAPKDLEFQVKVIKRWHSTIEA